MASLFMGSCKVLFFMLLTSTSLFYLSDSTEFQVGGDDNWTIPKKDAEMYNDWASRNRFKVDDTVHFKYEKDSVLEVTEEEYKKCRAAHPSFFSNNGNTYFKLDRPGFFYFISGVMGHCERGQRLIIKVLEPETPPPSANDTSSNSTDGSSNKSGADGVNTMLTSTKMFMLFGTFVLVLLLV